MIPNSSAGVNRSVGLFRFGDCSSGEQAARKGLGASTKGRGGAVLDAGRAEGEAQAAGCRGTGDGERLAGGERRGFFGGAVNLDLGLIKGKLACRAVGGTRQIDD